jgi:hypothetical protein
MLKIYTNHTILQYFPHGMICDQYGRLWYTDSALEEDASEIDDQLEAIKVPLNDHLAWKQEQATALNLLKKKIGI